MQAASDAARLELEQLQADVTHGKNRLLALERSACCLRAPRGKHSSRLLLQITSCTSQAVEGARLLCCILYRSTSCQQHGRFASPTVFSGATWHVLATVMLESFLPFHRCHAACGGGCCRAHEAGVSSQEHEREAALQAFEQERARQQQVLQAEHQAALQIMQTERSAPLQTCCP